MSDAELRERFAELRRAEAEAAPEFPTAPQRRATRAPWLVAATAAAAALLWAVWPTPEPEPADLNLTWTSATDALLDLPGDRWLREIPRLGETPSGLVPEPTPEDRSQLHRRTWT